MSFVLSGNNESLLAQLGKMWVWHHCFGWPVQRDHNTTMPPSTVLTDFIMIRISNRYTPQRPNKSFTLYMQSEPFKSSVILPAKGYNVYVISCFNNKTWMDPGAGGIIPPTVWPNGRSQILTRVNLKIFPICSCSFETSQVLNVNSQISWGRLEEREQSVE